ncbi:hypothetical protein A6M27_06025 [Acidithiobacillus thiooxidans]|uniref:Uncharacterized protein n=1 Tax=Acidithiobacillus thiooxidans TaxID=930 RepID=A0A1C2J3W1_ACITH|nr:hypothetical protein A6M23_08640 [Acidithiobacillus thiooxidans]OCX75520.1 hypothetical protein A6P07_04180 [Acidithiobacillus thiooxidans]OCX78295.1 hypothetical protein A6O24_04805 [Acidithiobacillus thiooxidans]OCX81845.1 hypothetical protein A6P08_13230 [Acidithiobacillus thiooxidans]OCX82872.1 hypothetical protein A6O26_08535 [Acidithiobacillus thiooxidans]
MVRDIQWDQGQSHDSQEFFWWKGDTLVVNILGKPSASRRTNILSYLPILFGYIMLIRLSPNATKYGVL